MHPDEQRQDIAARIKTILTDMVGEAPQSEEARLIKDLGFDSLDLIDLAMRLEEEFSIAIPDEVWDDTGDKSIRDLHDLVSARLTERTPA
ncbi:acyl carrier protein [Niveispirillum fermenti]|uniref:acyl carrier protein n=1 Tax=Niveispirillum fermenti TaxID=1233113 RepID=UPI003A8AB466